MDAARKSRSLWPPLSFLARLDRQPLEDLLGGRQAVSLANHAALMTEGEPADRVFLLLDAVVKVTVRLDPGMALLAVRVGGDVVGEMAVVDGGVRSATVTATRAACLAVEVPAAEFIAFVDRHPSAGRLLSAELSRRLRSSDRRRIDFTAYEVPARVARVLTELADDYGRPWLARPPTISLGIGITQAELASLVGAKEASVQQALSELRERKILSWQYRAVELYDMESLRKVAEGIS